MPLGVCLTVSGGYEHASNPLSERKARTVNNIRDETEKLEVIRMCNALEERWQMF